MQRPVTYVSPPETAFDCAGQPRCHLLSSPTAAAAIGHHQPLAPADHGHPSPRPFLLHAWPDQQHDQSPNPNQGQDPRPQDPNPETHQGQGLGPQGGAFQGARVLQELAKLRASEQPDWEEEEQRPGLGVGSSMSIARRRQSMDSQASMRCFTARHSDAPHHEPTSPLASPSSACRHNPRSPTQPQPQPQAQAQPYPQPQNSPSLKAAMAAIAASSASAMAAAAAAAALPGHARRRSALTALSLSHDAAAPGEHSSPSPSPSPSARSFSSPSQRTAPSPRLLNRPATCLHRTASPLTSRHLSTSQTPDPAPHCDDNTPADSPPWPILKSRRSSLDLPGPRPLHLTQLSLAYRSQPGGPFDSPRSPGQEQTGTLSARAPKGAGGRSATGLGGGSPRRPSAAIADEGQALIRQLHELDSHYGLREDGTTVATLTLRQHELQSLHGVGSAAAAAAAAPPTPEWELPLGRRPSATAPHSGGLRPTRTSQAGHSEHSADHSTRSSYAGYLPAPPTATGGQVGRGSFTGQVGHSSSRTSHTGHIVAQPGGLPPAAAAAVAAGSSAERRGDSALNSRVVEKLSEKLSRLFTWKHQHG